MLNISLVLMLCSEFTSLIKCCPLVVKCQQFNDNLRCQGLVKRLLIVVQLVKFCYYIFFEFYVLLLCKNEF